MPSEHSLTKTERRRKIALLIGASFFLVTSNVIWSSRLIHSSTQHWIEQLTYPQLDDKKVNDSLTLPCLKEGTKGCRCDEVGEFLQHESSLAIGSTGILHPPSPALPARLRIPRHLANNLSAVDMHLASYNLADYNPVLYPLYRSNGDAGLVSDLDERLLDDLTGRSRDLPGADRVRYVMVARSTNHHKCPRPAGVAYRWRNWLTAALLDESLAPVPGAHVAVNLERLYIDAPDPRVFLDYQLFAARTTRANPKKDQLFVLAAGFVRTTILPIALRRVASPAEAERAWDTKLQGPVFPPTAATSRPNNDAGDDEAPTSYGSGLQVKLLDTGGLRMKGHGSLRLSPLTFFTGKNLHVFEGSDNKTYVESWPFDPEHVYLEVNFFTEGSAIASLEDMPRLGGHSAIEQGEVKTPDSTTNASFANSIQPKAKANTGTRGTSGFVDMELAGQPVKVGISHNVISYREPSQRKKHRNYLSRFYAFLPYPPFPVVAYSGYFCLGAMHPSDAGWDDLWVTAASYNWTPLMLDGETFACIKTTFASGFAEYVGHGGNYAIISYGVRDCYSRSVVVHKKRIEKLLLGNKNKKNETGGYAETSQS